jgi:hypothetical protein
MAITGKAQAGFFTNHNTEKDFAPIFKGGGEYAVYHLTMAI